MVTDANSTNALARPDAALAPLHSRAHEAPERRTPELLSPAGDWDCAKAAVENGADAIYFGLDRFNARIRANNFTESDLPALMEFLHKRGVRGYVSFNTLIFANELEEARSTLRTIIAAGVDAAIVQDVGICRMIPEISPKFLRFMTTPQVGHSIYLNCFGNYQPFLLGTVNGGTNLDLDAGFSGKLTYSSASWGWN